MNQMEASPSPPVQVRPDAVKGRSLHATRSFAAGDVISTFTPLVLLPSLSHLSSVCTYCLRPGNPRACTRCRAAFYCGAACQAADWKAIHGAECKLLQRAAPRQLPTPVRVLLRALVKVDIAAALEPLEGHVSQRRNGRSWPDLQMMAMGASAFAGKGDSEEQVRKAVDLLCKIQTNAFHRYDIDLGQVGIFLEPTLAMANHSCMPNSLVQFVGRKAVLRAETEIHAGDEIQISYTGTRDPVNDPLDYTFPLSKRREALSTYMFECRCPRCKDDLNIYQACAASSNVRLNTLSIVPNLSNVQSHPAVTNSRKAAAAREYSEAVAGLLDSEQLGSSGSTRLETLKQQYQGCKELVVAELWALPPLPQTLTEISINYAEDGNFPFALAIACHIATACDPYRYPAPFHPVRAKGLVMIAKLLANTAADTASLHDALRPLAAGTGSRQSVEDALQDIDQVSLCEMLLVMVLKYSPAQQEADWELSAAAREMLVDIERLPGREKELSLINAWKQEPYSEQSQAFFEYAVVKQIDTLAKLGRAILKVEFG
ncbi:Histone-lysine N-methyltransferase SMYD3 [Paramyrothecium foliicola]|nr:Histone-lysine N-methyltransferase SMYD3 [Paramyrothecium foliicola]